MAGTRRSLEQEAFWRRVLDRQRRSGLSVREFCQGEGVSEGPFSAWRRGLLKRDTATPDVADDCATERLLVPVEVISDAAISSSRPISGASNTLEIITPEGLTLRFDAQTRPETVAALVDVLAPALLPRRRSLHSSVQRNRPPNRIFPPMLACPS